MKLINLSFYPIEKGELEFVRYRHVHDKEVFSAFPGTWDVVHLKVLSDKHAARHNTPDEKYFPGAKGFFRVPWGMLKYIKSLKPDVVFVHAFIFPVQLFFLRRMLGKTTVYVVQHHAEFPFRSALKVLFQRRAYRGASLYLFTARELAVPFIKRGIIDDVSKVMQVMEVSSLFEPADVGGIQLHGDHGKRTVFLWVARLHPNKDPLTVLKAFDTYKKAGGTFRLFMIYSSGPLEEEVKKVISSYDLDHEVVLLGKRQHEEVRHWMSQADYFVSGSVYEGSGVALSEAMGCGCVPVVTDIPTFKTMTREGKCGYLYKAGDPVALAAILKGLPERADPEKVKSARQIFKEDLSPHAISRALCAAINSLTRR